MTLPETRSQKYPVGISSVALGEIVRQVPAGEAPPLPPNAQLAVIGKSVPRINGRAKVTGAAPFTVDVKLPGMLHACLLRSPHPHARILSIDTSAAERLAGVRAVHIISDVVGRAVGLHATQGHRDELGAGGSEAFRHDRARTVLAGAEEKAGRKLGTRDDKSGCVHF